LTKLTLAIKMGIKNKYIVPTQNRPKGGN